MKYTVVVHQVVFMKYTVVVHQVVEFAQIRWKAIIPDLPGCIAMANSEQDALEAIKESAKYHLEGMKADGEYIPLDTVTTHQIEI